MICDKAQYDSARPVVQFTAFSPSKAFADQAASDFNAACPVGSAVVVKLAGGDNGHLPNEYISTVTAGPAIAHSLPFGHVAMLPIEDGRLASVKCVRWMV